MAKICDHTSVGIIVWNNDRLLLIERAIFSFGFAVPAGHVDGDSSYEEAAARELKEEVGLDAETLVLVSEGRKENACKREGGTWHYWKMYEAKTSGTVQRSLDETKQVRWCTQQELKELAHKTEQYRQQNITEDEWRQSPGLEPVMYDLFTELGFV